MTEDVSASKLAGRNPASPLWRHALPNGVTVIALCFGLTALVFAVDRNFPAAIGCVLVAALLDACDGRVARATGTASRFGAELDSLSDVICFGAVPAFMLYVWGLNAYGAAGWIASLTVAAACALRLARFNVTAERPGRPSWMGHFFTGVPAPAGAFLALLPIYMESGGALSLPEASFLAFFSAPITAGLMISTWPTFSAKTLSRKALRLLFLPTLAGLLVGALGLLVEPWLTLSLAAGLYLLMLPFSKWRYAVHDRRNGLT